MDKFYILVINILILSGCGQNQPEVILWSDKYLAFSPEYNSLQTKYIFINDAVRSQEVFNWKFTQNSITQNDKTNDGFWIDNATFYAPDSKLYYKRIPNGVYLYNQSMRSGIDIIGDVYYMTSDSSPYKRESILTMTSEQLKNKIEDTTIVIHTFPPQKDIPDKKPNMGYQYFTFEIDYENKTIKQYRRKIGDHLSASHTYKSESMLVNHYQVIGDWVVNSSFERGQSVIGKRLFDEINNAKSNKFFMLDLMYNTIIFIDNSNTNDGDAFFCLVINILALEPYLDIITMPFSPHSVSTNSHTPCNSAFSYPVHPKTRRSDSGI